MWSPIRAASRKAAINWSVRLSAIGCYTTQQTQLCIISHLCTGDQMSSLHSSLLFLHLFPSVVSYPPISSLSSFLFTKRSSAITASWPFPPFCNLMVSYCTQANTVHFNSVKVICINKHHNLMTLENSHLEMYILMTKKPIQIFLLGILKYRW